MVASAAGIWLAQQGLRNAQRDQTAARDVGLNGTIYAVTRANIAAERIRIIKRSLAFATGLWLFTRAPRPSESTRRTILGAWVLVSLLDDFKSYLLAEARKSVQEIELTRLNAERQKRAEREAVAD